MSVEAEMEAQVDALTALQGLKLEREAMLSERSSHLPVNMAKRRKEIKDREGSKMKSDMKKSTAFVKKVKDIKAEGLQQCIRDTETLNLNQYITEIVAALLEMKFKPVDVPTVVKLCVSLHDRYEDFNSLLITGLRESVMKPLNAGNSSDDVARARRLQMRLLVEFYQIGVINNEELFCTMLRNIIGKDKSGERRQPMDLSGLTVFVKYGSETFFGKVPAKVTALLTAAGEADNDEFRLSVSKQLVPAAACNDMNAQINDAYQQLSTDLVKLYKQYKTLDNKYEKEKAMTGGVLTEAKQTELDNAKRIYERILSTVTSLADCLAKEVPVLEEEEKVEENKGISVFGAAMATSLDFGPYGDAESRAFYEDLPDLLTLTPLSILGFTPEQAAALRETWKVNKDRQLLGTGESSESESAEAAAVALAGPAAVEPDVESEESTTVEDGVAESLEAAGVASGDKVVILLQEKLPDCVTKQKADDFCVAFCYINTKNARKRLIQALFKVPRTRFELIPNYARIVASISRVFPEIGDAVVKCLFNEFYGIMKAKTANYLENKIKNIRYLGELVKFGVAPPIKFFTICSLLFQDFTLHNVDVFAALLETCGRYLYLLPYTHQRMAAIVETMLRLRRTKNLDLRRQTLLEGAYFTVMPPERTGGRVKKELTRIQKYIVYLFTKRLGVVPVDSIIKLLRKLPWESEEEQVELFVIKWAMKISRTKYVHIPLVADLMSGLSRYRMNALVRLVDKLQEEIQHSLETPHKREPQRILGSLRLLGELYNFNAVSSPVIIQTLYHIINFGHEVYANAAADGGADAASSGAVGTGTAVGGDVIGHDPKVQSLYDPINDLFRAQMVCEIITSCGNYFCSGANKDKMNAFLMYFQRYLMCKANIPLHIEFAVLDALDMLEQHARSLIIQAQAKAALVASKKGGKRGKRGQPLPQVNLPQEYLFTRYNSMDVVQTSITAWEASHVAPGVRSGGLTVAAEEVKEEEEEEEEEERVLAAAGNEAGEAEAERDGEGVNDEEEDTESDSGSDSDSSGDSDSEDDDESDSEEEEDQEAIQRREEAEAADRARRLEEEDEFERAFKDVMQESVVSAQQVVQQTGSRGIDVSKMILPATIPKAKNQNRTLFVPLRVSSSRGGGDEEEDFDDLDDEERAREKEKEAASASSSGISHRKTATNVAFKLLSRDGKGRLESRELYVPQDNAMVVKLQRTEEAMRQERQRLKEKVLLLNKNSSSEVGQSLEEIYGRGAYGSGLGETGEAGAGSVGAGTGTGGPPSKSDGRQSRPSGGGYPHRQQQAAPAPQPPSLSTGKDSSIVKTYSTTERTRRTYTGVRADETHKSADTLDLNEFLAATHKVEGPWRTQPSNPVKVQKPQKKDDTASSYF